MDFRRDKLWLTLGITSAGMLVALAWHGWQQYGLHRGYPYNTCFYLQSRRFTDLTQLILESQLASPYDTQWAGYFPSTYPVIRCLGALGDAAATFFYLSFCSLGFLTILVATLRSWHADAKQSPYSKIPTIALATALMLGSFPFYFCIDRANLELFMALSAACAMYCFHRGWCNLGMLCLFPAICFKLYPAVLLALFVRPRHFYKPLFLGGMFLAVNYLSFFTFDHSLTENWKLWQSNLAFWNSYYLIGNSGLNGSASPWSTIKGLIATYYYVKAGVPSGEIIVLSQSYLEVLHSRFSDVALLFLVAAIFHTILIEREFFRRASILFICIPLTVPFGFEYRLLYVDIAIVILILVQSRRKHDFLIVGLLAFATIPKREVLLPYLGCSDSGFQDISIGIFITPPCMLAALWFLIRDGLRDKPFGRAQQKAAGLMNSALAYAYKGPPQMNVRT